MSGGGIIYSPADAPSDAVELDAWISAPYDFSAIRVSSATNSYVFGVTGVDKFGTVQVAGVFTLGSD